MTSRHTNRLIVSGGIPCGLIYALIALAACTSPSANEDHVAANRQFLPDAPPMTTRDLMAADREFRTGQALAIDLDVDGDGDAMLVPFGSALQVFRQTGGDFAQVIEPRATAIVADGGRAVVGDVDLDGDSDLLLLSRDPARPHRLIANRWAESGKFGYSSADATPVALPVGASVPLFVDFDADGDLDIVSAPGAGGSWTFLRSSIRPSNTLTFTDVSATVGADLVGSEAGVVDARAADLDGDGDLDIVAVGPGGTQLLENDGGQYVDATAERELPSDAATAVALADFDLDGDAEIVTVVAGATRLYLNEGPGLMREVGGEALLRPVVAPAGVVVGDLNFDNFPDLVVTSSTAAEGHRTFLMDGVVAGIPHFDDMAPTLGVCCPAEAAIPDVFMDTSKTHAMLVIPSASSCEAKVYLAAAVDDDCDKIPDAWERVHRLDALNADDADSDGDHDGVSAFEEWWTNRDPRRAISRIDGLRDDESLRRGIDRDGDSRNDAADNCPSIANGDQRDDDADGQGDICDDLPFGETGVSMPLSSLVTEYQQTGFSLDHRYLTSAQRSELAQPGQLVGYNPNRGDFRWFDGSALGLRAIYELRDPARGVHAYFKEEELSNNPKAKAGARVVGFASVRNTVGALRGLAKLRRFQQSTFTHQVLTTDSTRAAELLRSGYVEWGSIGYVLSNAEASNAQPVLEFFPPIGAARRYSVYPAAELDFDGHQSAGRVFRIFPRPSDATVPLYRVYNVASGDELLTTSRAERDAALATGSRDEGILGFVLPFAPRSSLPLGGALALQRLRLPTGEHAYTADTATFERLLASGAVSLGTAGWVVRQPDPNGAPMCTPHPRCGVSKRAPGQRLILGLREVTDERARNIAAAQVLNGMCSLKRVLEGAVSGGVEEMMAERVARYDVFTRAEAHRNAAAALDGVSPEIRAELLGRLVSFDPGACDPAADPAPDWDGMIRTLDLRMGEVPRLRTNFCSDSVTYDPPEIAERAITAGAQTIRGATGGEFGTVLARAASAARPVIEGIGTQGRPESELGHPALVADWHANHQPPPPRRAGRARKRETGSRPMGPTQASCVRWFRGVAIPAIRTWA